MDTLLLASDIQWSDPASQIIGTIAFALAMSVPIGAALNAMCRPKRRGRRR